MATGLADRRQPLEKTAMFSSAKRIYKSPRQNEILDRNTLVYCGDYRESCRKVGTNNVGMLAALLYEGIGLCIRTDDMPDKQLFGPVLRLRVPYLDLCYPQSWLNEVFMVLSSCPGYGYNNFGSCRWNGIV